MTPAEKKIELRGYARGYEARRRDAWPEHRPPTPPDARVAALLKAAIDLRDATDAGCATFDPVDEFVVTLNSAIDALDAELRRWAEWLREHGDAPSRQPGDDKS